MEGFWPIVELNTCRKVCNGVKWQPSGKFPAQAEVWDRTKNKSTWYRVCYEFGRVGPSALQLQLACTSETALKIKNKKKI